MKVKAIRFSQVEISLVIDDNKKYYVEIYILKQINKEIIPERLNGNIKFEDETEAEVFMQKSLTALKNRKIPHEVIGYEQET